MALTLPVASYVGQLYTLGLNTWQWDGVAWTIQSNTSVSYSAITATGTITAAQFAGPLTGAVTGNVTGNLTGNVTGNLTGNVTGNVTGNLTGTATSANGLTNSVNINGVAFNGASNITVTADANTLTGTTLKNTILTSSLTSVGTLGSLTVTNRLQANSITLNNGVITANKAVIGGSDIRAFAIAMGAALS